MKDAPDAGDKEEDLSMLVDNRPDVRPVTHFADSLTLSSPKNAQNQQNSH